MRKVLSQDEIDALFSAAQPRQKSRAAAPKKHVERCDLGKSKTLSAEQIRDVNILHEGLARRLGDSLDTYLRTSCGMNLVAVEQLRYSEFLGRVPELSYLASLRMLPIDAGALILMDLSMVFPIIDLALGGSGGDATVPRDTTEIEDQIMETVISLIARDLQITWAPVVTFDIQFAQRQPLSQAYALMLPNERILSLNFEIRLLELRGGPQYRVASSRRERFVAEARCAGVTGGTHPLAKRPQEDPRESPRCLLSRGLKPPSERPIRSRTAKYRAQLCACAAHSNRQTNPFEHCGKKDVRCASGSNRNSQGGAHRAAFRGASVNRKGIAGKVDYPASDMTSARV